MIDIRVPHPFSVPVPIGSACQFDGHSPYSYLTSSYFHRPPPRRSVVCRSLVLVIALLNVAIAGLTILHPFILQIIIALFCYRRVVVQSGRCLKVPKSGVNCRGELSDSRHVIYSVSQSHSLQ